MSTAQVNAVQGLGGKFDQTGFAALTIPTGVQPVIFYGGRTTPTVNNRQGFTKAGTATQVMASVTAAKTYIVSGFYWASNSATAINVLFGYNTATFTDNSAVAGGDIYYAPGGATSAFGVYVPAGTAGVAVWMPFPMLFPAGAFPFWIPSSNSGYSVIMVGYEL